jgi:superfamily II DNA or RNA helicase
MIFRDYQLAVASTAVETLAQNPEACQLLVLPTGAGKSVTILKIVQDLLATHGGPLLIVVHKRELVFQLADTMKLAQTSQGPARVVVERGEQIGLQEAAGQYDIAVCSIQTLQKRPEVLDGEAFGTVFIDETHRALADGYAQILDRVGVKHAGGPGLIGFTATDYRGDGQDLTQLFDVVSYKRDLVDFIRDAWLVPIKAQRIFTREIDNDTGQVTDRVVSDDDLYERVFDTFVEHCMTRHKVPRVSRPTLMMVQNVPQGIELEAYLRGRGVDARMVYSDMPDAERDGAVQAFRDGELDVLLGFNILIEGFDAPRASALFWLRNTASPVIFMQALGRVTRPFFTDPEAFDEFNASTSRERRAELLKKSAKRDALFFDFVDATSRYDVRTLGEALGVSHDFDFEGEDVVEVADQINAVLDAYSVLDPEQIHNVTEIARVTEDAELWRQAVTPGSGVPTNAQMGGYARRGPHEWVTFFSEMDSDVTWALQIKRDARGEYIASIGQPEVWKMWYYNPRIQSYGLKFYQGQGRPPQDETVTVFEYGKREVRPRYVRISGLPYQPIAQHTDLAEIFFEAEMYVYENFSAQLWKFKHKDAAWRSRPIGPRLAKGLVKMRKKGIPLPEDLDNGTAADLYKLFLLGLLKPPKLAKKRKRKRKTPAKN